MLVGKKKSAVVSFSVAVARGEEKTHVATIGPRGTTGESPTEKLLKMI
jgi:hypothetical protein